MRLRRIGMFLGVDPGVRGGAGIALIDDDGALLEVVRVERDPQKSIVQMMQDVWVAVDAFLAGRVIRAVAREDHNFLGTIERASRNQLRRMNGALDMLFVQRGFIPGENYLAFPVGSWKAVAGIPGDLGKEGKGTAAKFTKRKKITQKQYLKEVSEYLGYEHADIDTADAHGVALALFRVLGARSGEIPFLDLPEKVQSALWDRDRAGVTLHRAKTQHPDKLSPDTISRHFIRDFAP